MALAQTKQEQQNEVHHLTTTINQWWRGWHLLKVKLSDFDTRILVLSYSCYGVSIFNSSTTNWCSATAVPASLNRIRQRWTARKGVYNQIYVGAQYYGIFETMREQQKYINWQPQSINDNEDDTYLLKVRLSDFGTRTLMRASTDRIAQRRTDAQLQLFRRLGIEKLNDESQEKAFVIKYLLVLYILWQVPRKVSILISPTTMAYHLINKGLTLKVNDVYVYIFVFSLFFVQSPQLLMFP
jgi:hypothetical protein